MAEHLTECPVWRCCKPDERATMHTCICPDEEGIPITEHSEEEIGDDDFPIFTTNLNHLIDRGYPRGYADGLNAAREAVEVLPEYALRETCVSAIDSLKEKR